MATLVTRYMPADDTHGSSVRVTEAGTRRQRTYSYDYGARDAHESAAREFARDILGIAKPTVTEDETGRAVTRGKRFRVAGETRTFHGVAFFDSVEFPTETPLAYVTDGASYGMASDAARALAVRMLRNGATECAARGDTDGADSMRAAMERIRDSRMPSAEYAFLIGSTVHAYRVRIVAAAMVTD